jgi:hypothetical protein
MLERQKKAYRAFKLRGSTFAIALGESSIPEDDFLKKDGWRFIFQMRVRRLLKGVVPSFLLPLARRLRRLFQ